MTLNSIWNRYWNLMCSNHYRAQLLSAWLFSHINNEYLHQCSECQQKPTKANAVCVYSILWLGPIPLNCGIKCWYGGWFLPSVQFSLFRWRNHDNYRIFTFVILGAKQRRLSSFRCEITIIFSLFRLQNDDNYHYFADQKKK